MNSTALPRRRDPSCAKIRDTANSHDRLFVVEVDIEGMQGRFKEVPARPDLPQDISEQLIVELYSK